MLAGVLRGAVGVNQVRPRGPPPIPSFLHRLPGAQSRLHSRAGVLRVWRHHWLWPDPQRPRWEAEGPGPPLELGPGSQRLLTPSPAWECTFRLRPTRCPVSTVGATSRDAGLREQRVIETLWTVCVTEPRKASIETMIWQLGAETYSSSGHKTSLMCETPCWLALLPAHLEWPALRPVPPLLAFQGHRQ